MAVNIPQVVTEVKASGASVIDGSLRFDGTSNYLTKNFGSAGNRKKWTWSAWVKRHKFGVANYGLFSYYPGSGNGGFIRFSDDSGGDTIRFLDATNSRSIVSSEQYRDTGWYHIVISVDTTLEIQSDRVKRYVNGVQRESNASASWPGQNEDLLINNSGDHFLGRVQASAYGPVSMSSVYFIDGLALGPGYFGFTDPLTNTWRPEKFRAEGTTFNDGTVWSSGSTVTGGSISNAADGFDGSTASSNAHCTLQATNTSTTANVTFAVNFKNVTKVEVFVHSSSSSGDTRGTCETPNGVTFTSPTLTNASQSFHTIYEGEPIRLKNIGWGINQNGATGTTSDAFRAFRINGEILIDSTTRNLDFGTNGFYLPFDGNTPIGQDQSGKGNNWTPVNFGGSTDITKATGALPILNTGNGGTAGRPGVFGSDVSATYTTTSASNVGGKYVFENEGTQPTFSFIRGATYTFDWAASDGHPLRFSTTTQEGGGTATLYSDGVVVVDSGSTHTTTITVPHNAPDTLYYYCNVHSGMGNSISVTTDETKADPYAWKNVLALPLVGSKNDVSNQINSGSSTKTVTVDNNATAISRGNFYGGSFDFDGSGDRLVLSSYGSDFTFDGDFTIECWLYIDDSGSIGYPNGDRQVAGVWTGVNGDWQLNYASSGTHNLFQFLIYTGGGVSTLDTAVNSTPYVNKWVHLAVVRNSGSIKFYIDGISYGSSLSQSASFGQTSNTAVGGRIGADGRTVAGSIQDFRIYKGVAKYTNNFIPASTNPDIRPDSPSGVGTKTQLTKITDGAVSFDGSSSFLSVDHSTDFDLTYGDFTLEGYFNHTHTSGYVTACGIWREANGADYWSYDLRMTHNGTVPAFIWTTNGTSVAGTLSATTPTGNSGWHHIAVTRSGTSLRIFVDGKLEGSTTTSDTFNTAQYQPFVCGNRGTTYYDGFMSDVRLIKGTALYTSDFIPPTRELTNVTNTKLLTCQNLTTDLPTIAQSDGGLPIYNTDATGTSITSGTRTDSNSANIDIALPLNGSNGGTTFTDVSNVIRGSGSAGTVTRSGTVTSTAQSLYYGSSAFFNGTDYYLEIPFPAISSTETWTIEWYQYQTANMPNPCTLCGSSGSSFFTFGTRDGNKIGFNWRNSAWSNGNRFLSPTANIPVPGGLINKWVHVVYQRNSDYTISVFANGELLQTSTNTYQASLGSGSDTGATLRIGNNLSTYWFSGYLQDIRIYSGVAKYGSSSFTPPTAPILPSTVSPSIVNVRGNSAVTNFNPFNTDINTVRGQETGYATLNPLISTVSLSDGNLKQAQTSGTWNVAVSSIPMSTGKWYCEVTLLDGNTFQIGIIKLDDGPKWVANFPLVDFEYGWGMVVDGVAKLRSDYITQVYGATDIEYNSTAPVAGDTIGMAYDADTQALTFYVNGISYGDTTSYWSYPPTPGEYVFGNSVVSNTDALWNFGQKPFKFPPPDGFQPLTSSTARPDTVIVRPDQHVGTTLYTGNNTVGREIDLGRKFDLVWVKKRNAAENHILVDTVRGANNFLMSDTTNQANTSGGPITDLNDTSIVVDNNGYVNSNNATYVAWTWKAGGNKGVFNVDDVGYANASDVNMSAGALNSTAYNTSQDWSNSSNTSGSVNTSGNFTPANMFNGILGNESVSGAVCFSTYASNASMTWTSPVSLTNLTSLRLYVDKSGSNAGFLRVNGNNYDGWVTSSTFTDGWITIPETYLETIQFGYTGGVNTATGIAGVEVNGQLLIDSGNSPANIPSIAATGSSVGTKQGFSIVKYTGSNTGGSTLAHGLGQIPDFVVCKNLDTSYNWFIWHNEFGNGENAAIYFTNAAKTTGYGTQPFVSLTEHAITLNNNDGVNGNYNYTMYAWHNVPGLQKFGSYEGNAATAGPFVELGFRPAIVWIKAIDPDSTYQSYYSWGIWDNKRQTYNPATDPLFANRTAQEGYRGNGSTNQAGVLNIDFLSNGFKIIASNPSEMDDNNITYIYCAWAEAPTFNLYGAQSNAR